MEETIETTIEEIKIKWNYSHFCEVVGIPENLMNAVNFALPGQRIELTFDQFELIGGKGEDLN